MSFNAYIGFQLHCAESFLDVLGSMELSYSFQDIALAIDDNGIKWIATEPICGGGICTDGGLASFDGETFTVYDSLNSTLNSNFIGAVTIDFNNIVWAGTGHGEVSSYDGTSWVAHPFPTKTNVAVTSIAADLYGYIWATTEGNGLYMYDGIEWAHFHSGNSVLVDYLSSVRVGPDNSVWVGGSGNTLFKFTDAWTELPLPEEVFFTSCISTDNENRVWVGSDGIFCNYHAGAWTVFNESITGIPDTSMGYVFDIDFDIHGNIWIAHSEGLIKYDGAEWTTYLPSNSGLLSRHIMSLEIDILGNMWIGTADTGLIAYHEGGVVGMIEDRESKNEDRFALKNAYPNPFSSEINIGIVLNEDEDILIHIIDMSGRKIKILHEGLITAGEYLLSWDGKDEKGVECPAGIYLVRYQAGKQIRSQRISKLAR
jgi:ligand-binding sensor domain-containing protein